MQIDTLVDVYLSEHIGIARRFPVSQVTQFAQAIYETYKKDGAVYMFGNGGGASIAEHCASDLGIHPFVSDDKHSPSTLRRLRVHCLNESMSAITRIANDIGYDDIFVEQLKGYHICRNDIVVAFSTSGNSPNIVKALEYAHGCEAITVLISGRIGGKAKDWADICILIPGTSLFPGQRGANNNCFHTEDFQTSISHIVTGLLKEAMYGEIVKHSYTTTPTDQEKLS